MTSSKDVTLVLFESMLLYFDAYHMELELSESFIKEWIVVVTCNLLELLLFVLQSLLVQ